MYVPARPRLPISTQSHLLHPAGPFCADADQDTERTGNQQTVVTAI